MQAPAANANANRAAHHTGYWVLEDTYVSDGSVWNTTTKIFDLAYPAGRIWQTSSGNGTLPSLNVAYGQGLPFYGDWSLEQKAGSSAQTVSTLSVRKLASSVSSPIPGAYHIEPGSSTPFQLSFHAYPATWTPTNLNWTLNLVDGSGTTVRSYTGTFTNNTVNNLTWVQVWDGKNNAGKTANLGGSINPVLSVGLQLAPSDPPMILAVHWASPPVWSNVQEGLAAVFQGGTDLLNTNYVAEVGDIGPGNVPGPTSYATNPSFFPNSSIYVDNYYVNTGPPARVFVTTAFQGLVTDDGVNMTLINNQTGFAFAFTGNLSLQSGLPWVGSDTSNYGGTFGIRFYQNPFFIDLPFPQASSYPTTYFSSTANVTSYFPAAGVSLGEIIVHGGPDNFNGHTWTIIIRSIEFDLSEIGNGPTTPPLNDVQSTSQGTAQTQASVPSCECGGLCALATWLGEIASQSTTHSSPIPIDVSNGSGRYYHSFTDLAVATKGLPLTLSRVYSSEEQKSAPRFGWNWNFQDHLVIEPNSGNVYHVSEPNPTYHQFTPQGTGYVTDGDNTDVLTQVDSTHYQIAHKNHTLSVYAVPSGVTPSKTLPFEAVLQKQIDQNGNANTFTWDATGKQLQRIEGPDPSQFIKLSWSDERGPDKAFDQTGRCVVYRYSSVEQPESLCTEGQRDWMLAEVDQPGNKVYQHGYHQVLGQRYYQLLTTCLNGVLQEKCVGNEALPGVMQEVTHREGATLSFSSNPSATPPTTTVSLTAPKGMPQGVAQVHQYTLDAEQRVVSGTDIQGRSASVVYDANHNVSGATNSLSQSLGQTFDARNNLLTSTDALNHTTTITYDTHDNPLTVTTPPDSSAPNGLTTHLAYDPSTNNLLSVTDPMNHTSTLHYTAFGKPDRVTDNLKHSWTFTYDGLGFLNSKTAPPAAPGEPSAIWHYTNDNLGRCRSTTDPLNRVSSFEYDVRDHLVSTTIPAVSARYRQEALPAATTSAFFDNNDLLVNATSVDGLVTTYGYDGAQRLTSVLLPGTIRPTTMQYDALEHVVNVTNSNGQTTHYDFDTLNRPVQTTYPGGNSEIYGYDPGNNLRTLNRGAYTVAYDYDSANRLTHLSSPTTQDDIVLHYDNLNRVSSMVDNTGTTSYSYTQNDLLQSVTHPGNKTLTYGYDLGDRLASSTDPEQSATTFGYSDRNELITATHDSQTVNYQHDLVGRTTLTQYPNGVSAQRAFSERNQLLYKNYTKSSSPLITLKYGFNQVDQRVVDEKIDPTGSTVKRFGYDDRRELTSSTRTDPKGKTEAVSYTFDQNHNLLSENKTSFSSNVADQLKSGAGSTLSYN